MEKTKEVLKRSYIKEELFALTGDTQSAIILNQFIYWSKEIKGFDQYVIEEIEARKGKDKKPHTRPKCDWISKTMEELKDETMLTCSTVTIGRKLSKIVENGWLERRTNPKYKWDKTYQYRVNVNKILSDLSKIGYFLQDYKFNQPKAHDFSRWDEGFIRYLTLI